MKQFCKTLLFTCLFCSSLLMVGQRTYHEFAPIGAKWHYGQGFFLSQYTPGLRIGFYTIESIKDTLINGKTARVLKEFHQYDSSSGVVEANITSFHYLYQEGGRIYDALTDELYYNFEAEAGDTWECSGGEVRVMSRDSIQVNDQWLIRMNVQPCGGGLTGGVGGIFIEKIGDISYIIPLVIDIHPFPYNRGVRCYQDHGIYFINDVYGQQSLPCDYTEVVGIASSLSHQKIKLTPNPIQEQLTIQLPDRWAAQLPITAQLYDYTGKQIQMLDLHQINTAVDMSTYRAGIFFLQIGEVTHKIIKQN